MATIYPSQNDGADHFIIGDVLLAIPPEDINTYRVENNNEINALRAKFPMFTKSGQSLFNATVTWKAVLGSKSDDTYYDQWDDVRRVFAIFKSAPFVQIENLHLSNVLNIQNNDRMIFGMRQLTISTIPDSIEVLQVTLDLTFFNYKPYSRAFGYLAVDGKETDSYSKNTIFSTYIDNWINNNLDKDTQEIDISGWPDQNTGNIKFSYRTYQAFSNFPNPQDPSKGLIPSSYPGTETDHSWILDYATNKTSFYYYDTELEYDSGSYDSNTIVTGISVNFRNNFAQIPLAAYQYPTYQHMGPAATTINIALQTNDPDAGDFGDIQQAINIINGQYFAMKSNWVSTSSVHKLQSINIQNQMLNMLGIGSVMVNTFNTATDSESLSTSAQLIVTQYEDTFEVLEPFRIKDPTAAHLEALQSISDPAVADLFSPEAKQAIKPLTDYWTAQKNGDINYLFKVLCNPPSDPNTTDSFRAALGQLPLQQFSQSGLSIAPFTDVAAHIFDPYGIPISKVVPGMDVRLNAGTPSYSDLIILTGWAKEHNVYSGVTISDENGVATNDASTAVYLDTDAWTKALVSYGNQSNPSLQTAIYKALFPLLYTGNAQFAQAVEEVKETPHFKNAIASSDAVQANGPGSDPTNSTHGSYADMGLDGINYGSVDYNPAYYLVDESKTIFDKVKTTITQTLNEAAANNQAETNVANGTRYVYTNDHLLMSPSLVGVTNTELFSRMNIELQNPAHAFPTYKLFLLEDKSGSLTYAYDDFYSYSSVQSIEVIKYQDKPDTAMITISNVAGLLNHRLYDNSADGYREWDKALGTSKPVEVVYSQNPSDVGGQIEGHDGVTTANRAGLRNGQFYADGNTVTPSPLKYYPLQTGSKIQVRVGYSNNPDKLFPTFSGIITEIDEQQEMITIIAQSFMLELMQPPEDFIATDHWNLLSFFTTGQTLLAKAVAEIEAGHVFDGIGDYFKSLAPNLKAPAFGQAIIGDDGTALGVITQMLKAPSAKHFGRWTIGSPSGRDPFVYGYQWSSNPSSSSTFTNTLSSLYDRSADNIMTSNRINRNGANDTSPVTDAQKKNQAKLLSRDWNYENGAAGPSEFHISSDKDFTPWDIIKDVSRRYPENILAVKNYGFPWNADATLVFANPYDYYRARPTSLTELGGSPANDKEDGEFFKQWWYGTGRQMFILFGKQLQQTNAVFAAGRMQGLNPVEPFNDGDASELLILDRTLSYEQFSAYLLAWAKILGNAAGPLGLGAVFNRVTTFFEPGEHRSADELVKIARDTLRQLQAQSASSIAKSKSGELQVDPSDLTLPVRKFHFANQDSIIHNGLKLNGDVYNTVKIGEVIIPIADSIPSHHRRVLDCNNLIVDRLNVTGSGNDAIRAAYAQSFLAEEMGKMYEGELILRGMPEIEPFDILIINDPFTAMKGAVRVKKVIQSYDNQQGFITIVTPECLMLINEAATAKASALIDYAVNAAWTNKKALFDAYYSFAKNHSAGLTTVAAGVATTIVVATPGIIAGAAIATTLIAGTVLLPVAVVGAILLAAYGIHCVSESIRALMPIIPMPLSRYGNLWCAGMEGFRSENFFELLKDKYEGFVAEEFYPLLESWRALNGAISPSIAATPSLVKMTATGEIAAKAVPLAQGVSQNTSIPANIIWAHWAFESNGFTNRGARTLNNLSGINVPGGHGKDYRDFPTLQDYATYYQNGILKNARYVSQGVLRARTVADFATALKKGGYFRKDGNAPETQAEYNQSLTNYIGGMNHYLALYKG